MSEACRSSFPPQSSFTSSRDLETTGKAALASDRDPMCPGWVPFLPTFQQVFLLLLWTPGPVGGSSG